MHVQKKLQHVIPGAEIVKCYTKLKVTSSVFWKHHVNLLLQTFDP